MTKLESYVITLESGEREKNRWHKLHSSPEKTIKSISEISNQKVIRIDRIDDAGHLEEMTVVLSGGQLRLIPKYSFDSEPDTTCEPCEPCEIEVARIGEEEKNSIWNRI